ncbi:efflux RND transporter periplasmic adaptor subunit [Marinobacter koreensis]|uniref:Efflux RND transporter periplasmic adaptor subunit n=1 Tax=Marinobacter koreensis TaxID=335974 RepID=A0ABW0RJB5_9GAMM|nr:HlyD family efflux transporter periplasmic adaptor subunit [Marinobacter koreensis]MCK7547283.1 HlyD family efflux transporter periplasmic adaptor subunit [Marinobacter koreensis]
MDKVRHAVGKWLFWIVCGVLAAGALFLTLRPDPVWVDLAVARKGPLEVTVTEEGKTRVRDRYVISTPVSGYLRRVTLEVGDTIKTGDVVAEIDPMPTAVLDARSRAEAQAKVESAASALKSARQQVSAAEAEARIARQEFARLQSLTEKGTTGFVSGEQLDQARARTDHAEAMLRSARFEEEVMAHELAAARTRLDVSAARMNGNDSGDRVTVHSPVNGAVLSVARESEGVIQAGDPILEVGDPAALEVVVDVLSFDAVKLKPGMPVRFDGWGGVTLKGVVRRVEPVGFEDISALGVEEQRVQVVADILSPFEDWQSLGDGYRVDASFILWSGDDVLTVPSSAVFDYEGQSHVFIARGDTVVRTPVRTGRSNGLDTQILEGLSAGDQVVRHPDRQLEDGTSIRVR